MLGTKDKRTSQTFLIEGLSSTKAPIPSVSNQVFENYLSGVRSSSLNYLFYKMKIMKVQNVPTHFIKGDFIYIPCSWIITKPYTHAGHAAYTIYICAGKRWKKLCQTSFLINFSSSPRWVPFFYCGMLKVKDSSELQLTKTLVNAVQLDVIIMMFFWVNKHLYSLQSSSLVWKETVWCWKKQSPDSACIYTLNSPPVTIIPTEPWLLSSSFATQFQYLKWSAVIHSSSHSISDQILKRQ